MRNKSFLSSIFHPFVCRTNRTGYLQFIQFFNCSFPAGDAPLGKTSKSPLHFADYRGESVISSYYISAPRPQARSVEQPPQTVPTASTTSAVRVQTASTNTPCQCAKRKFYPLAPRPPPERWHGCGYCCRIECTVGEAGLRIAKASSLYNTIRKLKTDRADALKIANYALTFWDILPPFNNEEETRLLLKMQSRANERITATATALRNGLIALADQTFPGVA